MNTHGLLFTTAAFLAAAVVSVPIAKRFGLGSVLGYLVAGALIGPFVLRVVSDPADILHVSEMGVVMLLFVIGLELNPRRLWEMRAKILGLGPLQVALCAGAVTVLLLPLGWDLGPATVAGLGFALSSTAIVLQILAEKGIGGTQVGKDAFSVLLFQDLAVIPMLALLPLLGASSPATHDAASTAAAAAAAATHGIETSGLTAAIASLSALPRVALTLSVIVAIVVAGRTIVRPVFRLVANTRMREIFTALSLLIVVGIALVMEMVGLSMALGTFLAGVVLADSEYRHELEATIEPFKGILMGLFFTSVGSSMDFSLLATRPGFIVSGLALLLGAKVVVLLVCARIFGQKREEASLFAVLLSQGGEFAFVLFNTAVGVGALSPAQSAELTLVVALSMASTPFLLIFHERIVCQRAQVKRETDAVDGEHNPVILAGLGRVGQITARLLHTHKIRTTIIDYSPDLIDRIRSFGFKAFYGDATQLALLEAAGIAHAKVLILAIDDRAASVRVAEEVRKSFPHVKIIARAFDVIHAYELRDAGVTEFERETFDAALGLGERTLVSLGQHPFLARRAIKLYKRYDLELIERLYAIREINQEYLSVHQEWRDEVTRMFESDEKLLASGVDAAGWNT